MNKVLHCPGCGFRGRLPESLHGLQALLCPNCRTVISQDQLSQPESLLPDESVPIVVDGNPAHRALTLPAPQVVSASVESRAEVTYSGAYMSDEAARFTQYVNVRLAELHQRRQELAGAESNFETTCMTRKQELHQLQLTLQARTEQLNQKQAELQAKETELQAKEAELQTKVTEFAPRETALASLEVALAAREVEVSAREGRVARAARQVAEADRRMPEIHAAIEQLEVRRAELAEEREALARRAEALDRAELTLQRRETELDEFDERLRQEQEDWEREHAQANGQLS